MSWPVAAVLLGLMAVVLVLGLVAPGALADMHGLGGAVCGLLMVVLFAIGLFSL